MFYPKAAKKYQCSTGGVVARPWFAGLLVQMPSGNSLAKRRRQPDQEFGIVLGGEVMKPDLEVVQIGRAQLFKAWEHG
jgi:hypothetical protein